MKKGILLLYIITVFVLAIATFIEYSQGGVFAGKYIYHTFAFCALWGMLSLLTIYVLYKRQMWRRFPSLLLHISFIIILVGALTSFLTSKKGYMHLRTGDSVSCFMEQGNACLSDLPFTLVLDSFRIEYYPGTEAPSDYVSWITCIPMQDKTEKAIISMNRIFKMEGYRFYQSSYDEDKKGTVLTVNYDPWGTSITYIGYLSLVLSMIAVLLNRRGRFRKLIQNTLLKSGKLCMCLLLGSIGMRAFATNRLTIIPEREADSLSCVQVIYHDRIVPYNTLARDFVKKLSGKEYFSGLKPEQILGSWQKYPEEWKYVPIIRIKNAELRRRLGLDSSYARLVDLFEDDNYRLREWWNTERGYASKPSALEKAILDTDEKVALIGMLYAGTLICPLPTDGNVLPLSSSKVQAELLYNRIPFSKYLFMSSLTLGILSFGWMLFLNLGKNCKRKSSILIKWVNRSLKILLYLTFGIHIFGYLLRWYIAGRIPLSNGYETMQFMALCILGFACVLCRRFLFVISFGFLLSGFTLLVSWLGEMNPQITPLVPVLMSPWLSAHVSFIMMSYALLAFILFNGILAFCLPHSAVQLMRFSQLLLYPAVFFLGIGIFIGAVWANVSWGRYWAWDPKEVWALITFMVYGLAFHDKSLFCFNRPRFFHAYMILSFLTVLMTYFGVNFFLGGMHSYA